MSNTVTKNEKLRLERKAKVGWAAYYAITRDMDSRPKYSSYDRKSTLLYIKNWISCHTSHNTHKYTTKSKSRLLLKIL